MNCSSEGERKLKHEYTVNKLFNNDLGERWSDRLQAYMNISEPLDVWLNIRS